MLLNFLMPSHSPHCILGGRLHGFNLHWSQWYGLGMTILYGTYHRLKKSAFNMPLQLSLSPKSKTVDELGIEPRTSPIRWRP